MNDSEEPTSIDGEATPEPRPTMPMTASGPTLAYSRSHHREQLREASDKELLFALKRDDESALDELIERKTEPLIKAVYRILHDDEEARDIVQVTFFRLWEHRQRFDDKWAPNTWIYRIATNLAIDHLRSRQSKQKNTEPMRLHLERRFDDRSRRQRSELQETEVMSIFHELAEGLTEKQRAVFLLREVEGMASSEVAQIVGCRESTVRNHLFNARRYLRQELLARYPEYGKSYGMKEQTR
ncbi:MAG: RNA polymerase sigma factor [Acidobacteriota bacterium]